MQTSVTFKNIDPKEHLLNISDADLLEETIEYALQKPPELMAKITDFINQTHPYNDGESSARVLNAVDEVVSGKFALAKKPRDIIRQFKMRKKLNYWR